MREHELAKTAIERAFEEAANRYLNTDFCAMVDQVRSGWQHYIDEQGWDVVVGDVSMDMFTGQITVLIVPNERHAAPVESPDTTEEQA